MAGQGLLLALLNRTTSLSISGSDGNRWIETYGKPRFIGIQNKLILEYISDDKNYDDSLILFSWIPKHCINDLREFVKNKKPKQVLIIGENFTPDFKNINKIFMENNYSKTNIPSKQICNKDYYYLNKVFPDNCCRSSSTIYLRDDLEPLNLQIIKEKCGIENFCDELNCYTAKK